LHKNKLLKLHHELFYPAFLGAVIYDFARKVAEEWSSGFDYLQLFSVLFFIAYFSAAFLSLAEAEEDENAIPPFKFGFIAFIANFFEIGLILYISTLIASPKFDAARYDEVYFFWIAIPLTAFISNIYSGRRVRKLLSGTAFAVGLMGLIFAGQSYPRYIALLAVMSTLLLVYFIEVFTGCPNFGNARLGPAKDGIMPATNGLVWFIAGLIVATDMIGYCIYHDKILFTCILLGAGIVLYNQFTIRNG
jgi:hypothetical protein